MKYRFKSTLFVSLLLSCHFQLMALDQVRIETRTDESIGSFGIDGEGTIIAILDRGLDWRLDDFRNEDGSTRIKYILDLSDPSGANAPENTIGVGTVYTEAQINDALTNNTTLNIRDAVGHGTTTTGTAAGNGSRIQSKKYRGIAPKASLIVVKAVSEGAAAHDDQPAETAFTSFPDIYKGIDFVVQKASELGMPVVMLLNFGSNGGPTDGTSEFTRKIDSTVGAGIKGVVIVNGPGDEGGANNRASASIDPGETLSLEIAKGQAGTLRLDLWYPILSSGENTFSFTVNTPSGSSYGPYASVTAENQRDTKNQAGIFNYYHNGRDVDFHSALNQKRELMIDIFGETGTYTLDIHLSDTASSARDFIATLNWSAHGQNPKNEFLNYRVPGNIWDGATSLNNICPGDYNIRQNWTDINGIARSNPGQGDIGGIWLGSSIGPTFDGRRGVDFCAPGDSLFTSYAPDSWWATAAHNLIQDGEGHYGRANAVSAAAPIVTGIISLMLQANPELDAIEIRQMLQETARQDSFTGTVPNTTWGYGKVDAFAAVAKAIASTNPGTQVTIILSGEDPLLEFTTLPGLTYTISFKDDLRESNWKPLSSGIAGSGNLESFRDQTFAPNVARFYLISID